MGSNMRDPTQDINITITLLFIVDTPAHVTRENTEDAAAVAEAVMLTGASATTWQELGYAVPRTRACSRVSTT